LRPSITGKSNHPCINQRANTKQLSYSETGAANEGKLPAIWAQEAKEEQARVKEIKCKGAHARYEYVPVVTVSTQENRKKLGELKNFLESRLQFRTV